MTDGGTIMINKTPKTPKMTKRIIIAWAHGGECSPECFTALEKLDVGLIAGN